MDQTLQERFRRIQREYKKGKRKLEKLQRKTKAKAHVQQKLREQAGLEEELTHSRLEETIDNSLDSRNSSLDLTSVPDDSLIAEGNDLNSEKNLHDNEGKEAVTRSDHKIGIANSHKTDEHICIETVNVSTIESGKHEGFKGNNHKENFVPDSKVNAAVAVARKIVTSNSTIESGKHEGCKGNIRKENLVPHCKVNIAVAVASKNLISKTPSLTKYRKRNHVVKLSGDKMSPQCVKGSPVFDQGGAHYHQSFSLEKLDVNSNHSSESSCTFGNGIEQGTNDSEAIIFERKQQCDIKKPKPGVDSKKCIKGNSEQSSCFKDSKFDFKTNEDPFEKEALFVKDTTNKDHVGSGSLVIGKEAHCVKDNTVSSGSLEVISSNSDIFSSSSSTLPSQLSLEDGSDDILRRSLSRRKRKSRSMPGPRRVSQRVTGLNKDHADLECKVTPNFSKKMSSSKVQNHLIISSMFQCLIDDVKRDNNKIEDFYLPSDYPIGFKSEQSSPNVQPQDVKDAFVTDNEGPRIEEDKAAVFSSSEVNIESKEATIIKKLHRDDVQFNSRHTDSNFTNKNSVEKTTAKTKAIDEDLTEFTITHAESDKESECFSENCGTEASPIVSQTKEIMEDLLVDKRYDSFTSHFGSNSSATSFETPNGKLNQSQTESGSPTLFESPTSSFSCSGAKTNDTSLQTFSDDKTPDVVSDSVTGKSTNEIGICLEQKARLEVPCSEVVLSLVSVVTHSQKTYIICLCTQSLKFYCCTDSCWTNVVNYALQPQVHMKKNSGGRLYALRLGKDEFGILLQHPKTSVTSLHMYMYDNGTVSHGVIDTLRGKNVNVKAIADGVFCTSFFSSPSSFITKYTFKNDSCNNLEHTSDNWQQSSLDHVSGIVTCLVTVQNLDSALIGLTVNRKLHIWNDECGVLLCTVDVGDVCPKEMFCPTAISEQGYVFLPVLCKKKGHEVGSVVVVNPIMASSETLIPLQPFQHNWNGCFWASLLTEDVLCARETTGQISLWDVYDGHWLSTLDGSESSSCFTSNTSLMAFVCKNVLHVYGVKSD